MVRAITGVKNQTINKNILDAGKRVVNQKNIALPSKVLANLEQNLNHLHEIVKDGQLQLERRRVESDGQMGNFANQRPDYVRDFRMN